MAKILNAKIKVIFFQCDEDGSCCNGERVLIINEAQLKLLEELADMDIVQIDDVDRFNDEIKDIS